MTCIDFYTNISDKINYACQLVRKIRANTPDSKIVLLTKDPRHLAELDKTLWTFSEPDFLPHVIVGDPLTACTPIILTDIDSQAVDLPHHQTLINLSGARPVNFSQFERMVEIISSDEVDIANGRQRYGFYKKEAFPLSHVVAE
jgi:DNA polymerase-3 subunit chi